MKKKVKKTTCNVLIRDYPVNLSEKVKQVTGEKTLSKALISISERCLKLENDHASLLQLHEMLRDESREISSTVFDFMGNFDKLRELITGRKGS